MVQAGAAAGQREARKKNEAEQKAKQAAKETRRRAREEQAHDDPSNPAVKQLVADVTAPAQHVVVREQRSTKSLKSSRSLTLQPEYLPRQRAVRRFYERNAVQMGVAGLIFGNFIVSASNAELWKVIDPAGTDDNDTPGEYVFYGFEIFFNSCFTVELFVNMYGKFPCTFWKDPWNVFDFVIVWVSLLSMVARDVPGISVLRLFRSFRVFRLFKRIRQLKLIIEAVMKSLPGVCNAFVVLLLIMSIWAIIAVQFFREDEWLGPTHFGDFFRALVTFFQIMTFDGWCSTIARPLILEKGVIFAGFFVTYVFVNSIMMTNVVVAILLEKFIKAQEELKLKEEEEEEEERMALLNAHNQEKDTPSWHMDADRFEAEMLNELRVLAREFDELQQDLDVLRLEPHKAAGDGYPCKPQQLHAAPDVATAGGHPVAGLLAPPGSEPSFPVQHEASGEAAGEMLRFPPDPPCSPHPTMSLHSPDSPDPPSAPQACMPKAES